MNENNVKDIICNAASELHTVVMIYTNSSEGLVEREIEPYEIRDDEDFFGFDVQKQGIRRFKLGLISSMRKSNNKFTPKWDIKMN